MKLYLAIAFAAMVAFGADEAKPSAPVSKDGSKTASKTAAARTVEPLKLPAGAVEVEPETWKYTDARGVKWIYRRTPFGLTRYQDKPAAEAARKSSDEQDAAPIKAEADGDVIRFERPGPFGTYRWSKKPAELNETEKAAWERSKAASKKQE